MAIMELPQDPKILLGIYPMKMNLRSKEISTHLCSYPRTTVQPECEMNLNFSQQTNRKCGMLIYTQQNTIQVQKV